MKPKIKTAHTGNEVETAAQQPSTNILASLAAQPRFEKLPGAQAAQAALELWHQSQAVTVREQKQVDLCRKHYVAPLEHLRPPKTRPASFEDFLKCVVQGKDEGEQLHRFREFLRWKIQRTPALYGIKGAVTETMLLNAEQKLLADFQAAEYSPAKWQTLALEFRRYWAQHTAEVRSRAGKKGAAVKARS
jgi:hypothetical protein